MAGDLNTHDQVHGLFTNFTWTKENLVAEEMNIVKHWSTPYTDVFSGLLGYVLFTVRRLLFIRGLSQMIDLKRRGLMRNLSISVYLLYHKLDGAGTFRDLHSCLQDWRRAW